MIPENWPSPQMQHALRGELYDPAEPSLTEARARARELMERFNTSKHDNIAARSEILGELFGSCGENVYIEPPFYCDYGTNIHLGQGVYMNFNCVILDCSLVSIGSRTLLAPAVQVYAATHPISPSERAQGLELAKPIKIGSDCWIGGGAIILPGVTIGDGVTVAAGSVVTKNVEDYCVVAGNPAKVIRKLERPN